MCFPGEEQTRDLMHTAALQLGPFTLPQGDSCNWPLQYDPSACCSALRQVWGSAWLDGHQFPGHASASDIFSDCHVARNVAYRFSVAALQEPAYLHDTKCYMYLMQRSTNPSQKFSSNMPSIIDTTSVPTMNDTPKANGSTQTKVNGHCDVRGGHADAAPRIIQPLQYSGSLDQSTYHENTPAIGRQYTGIQVRKVLGMQNRDQIIRDIAYTVSSRGVIFLKDQDVTPQEMKTFGELLSNLAGCPEQSTLHVHPLTEEGSELGDQISVISSAKQAKGGGLTHQLSDTSRLASVGWHADITFEAVPSDYAMLKIHTLPPSGGDTLWASGYEIYDRLSPAMQVFLEGLTATHDATFFHDESRRLGNPLRKGIRGHPLNQGDALTAVHPVIRTNPVTGWKSVFVNRGFTKRINGVTRDESDMLLKYLFDLVVHNHDAQVRFRWEKNDMAIWDNRSVWHTATYDYLDARAGDRVCSLGEAPYLDLMSSGRKQSLNSM